MNYFIPQMDSSDCGFACLKMMIARLYENEKALYIKQDEHHGAYNFLELVDKASNYGITLEGVEIEQKEEIKSIKWPFIALIKKKNDLFHYVLVTKVKFGTIYYSDPDEGESFCTKKGFFSIWTGTSLIIKDFKKEDGLIFTSDDVCKNNKSFAVALLQIFTSLFLATGIYFIDEKTKYLGGFLSICDKKKLPKSKKHYMGRRWTVSQRKHYICKLKISWICQYINYTCVKLIITKKIQKIGITKLV